MEVDNIGFRGVRIKLRFDDRNILTPEQLNDGLSNSWFFVGPHLESVADLASDIASSFQLSEACPFGISLRMENFNLPSFQPTCLLKDNDIISVNKKIVQMTPAHPNAKFASSSSPGDSVTIDMKGIPGVTPRATEEFEKETVGYQSEEEEDALEAPNEYLDHENPLPKATVGTKPKLKKKRKRGGDEEVYIQAQGHKLQIVPYVGDDTKQKDKKSKQKHPVMQEDIEQKRVVQVKEMHKSQKAKKGQQIGSSNLAEEAGKKSKKKQKDSRKEKVNDGVNFTVENSGASQKSQKLPCLSISAHDGNLGDLEKEIVMETEDGSIRKPSRSATRKKAKRRWKREHADALALGNSEKPPGLLKAPASDEEIKAVHFSFPNKTDDDGETEEEKLPVVVKPGHIRFEPLDEDEDNYEVDHSMPRIAWSNVVSKRRGQSWGQEKDEGRMVWKKYTERRTAAKCEFGEIVFESLPSLKIAPQEGDVLAYRLVELTPSMCPELSEFRVGKVVVSESQLGMLRLAPLPGYLWKMSPEDGEQELDSNTYFSSPYSEDGSLETQLEALVDIRLVKGSSNVHHSETSKMIASTDNHVNTCEESIVQLPDTAAEVRCDTFCPSSKSLSTSSKTLEVSPTVKSSATCHPVLSGQGNPVCQGVLTNLASAWQELSEVLDKRKGELCRLEGTTSTGEQNLIIEVGQLERGTENVLTLKYTGNRSDTQRRSWSKRSGGLGPTMALLRAQNVL